jgi:uncharacterized protein (TIGR02145 family)
MKKECFIISLIFSLFLILTCKIGNAQTGDLTYNGYSYKTVKIGTQWWMAENLQTIKYNDGTAIPNVKNNLIWAGFTTGAYCWYENDTTAYKNYGAIYNWFAINIGKLCPLGWQVPGDAEWAILIDFLGGESVAGGKMKEAGTILWESPNYGATNESGFSGLPGGCRFGNGGFFGNPISYGYWWSSTKGTVIGSHRSLYYDGPGVHRGGSYVGSGFRVRCLQD